ncbi:hypothetical protein Thimo_3162 [Thioflavicoccus mobilis 8321]|uniref:L,D-TPase catalytic domain-containing protein n=1 Tax=Thioflavicoccus mobilis 8321 TaxID=765912 RepID=L0H1A5_9GAMM|nr:L,D-transpeptidase family protein [Thioflavicoccus mobilis]AGA91842.1 hypothetical protein Thimo_3162 [Thioflavicoccus mobilis 8321]
MSIIVTLMFVAALASTLLLLIRYEKAIPPLLVASLPEADAVLVEKGRRRLHLLRDGAVYRSYRISLGGRARGHKEFEGDLRTPEGRYLLDWRNPNSCCYKSLHVSYPGPDDRQRAAERGLDPGGQIMVHGQLNGWGWLGWLNVRRDWTHGCIAVRNVPMEEIWQAVPDGTPIEIRP